MKNNIVASALAVSATAALALAPSAHAHHPMGGATPGNLFEGLASGLAHPVIGLDHLLFILAVGVACYYFGRRAGTMAAFLARHDRRHRRAPVQGERCRIPTCGSR